MEHVVFHPGPDGAPAFRRCASLEDAIRYVEHLRNVEGLSEVSVHALSPVPVAFRAYYRVEVPADQQSPAEAGLVEAADAGAEAPVVDVPAPAEPVLETVPAPEPVPAFADAALAEAAAPEADVASNGKRTLGFFAH